MTDGPREDVPLDPDLLVLDDLDLGAPEEPVRDVPAGSEEPVGDVPAEREHLDLDPEPPDFDRDPLDYGRESVDYDLDEELGAEPVESYVPPYVPDPPPEIPARDRVHRHDTRSPRWFRILFLTAVMLIVGAVGSILHRQGLIERWFASLHPPEESSREAGTSANASPTEADVPQPGPTEEQPPVVEPEPAELPQPEPLPEPEPQQPLPDPEVELPKLEKPIVVRTSDNREITLQLGEILIELRNGNYLKGRLHKVTDKVLRLAVKGGHVDVELTRLRAPAGEDDVPYRAFEKLPRARVQLTTGEILVGRLLRSDANEVELVFPSGKIVLRRDMVRYVDRR